VKIWSLSDENSINSQVIHIIYSKMNGIVGGKLVRPTISCRVCFGLQL